MSRYKKRDGENTLDYLLRLAEIKIEEKPDDLEWSDIVNYCGFDCHYDSLRKALQPYEYGGYTIYKYLKDKYKDNSDDDVIKSLEETQREIYKERQKLRDEKNEFNTWLREQSRMELFFERIDESIDRLLLKKPRIIPNIKIKDNDIHTKVVVGIADPHYGVEFSIKGFDDNVINEYNPEIFKMRMWKLRDEILDFCKKHNANNVHIVDLGDSIEGLLHISQMKSLRGNIVDDILDYADFIDDWINSLSKPEYGLFIHFYTSHGNHSDLRLLTGKKGDFPHENLEKIYARVMQKAFKDYPNVCIHKGLDGLNYFNVNGYNFLTAHGNKEGNLKNSIKDYEDTYGIDINYFMVGHLHCKNEFDVSKDKEVIQVRSIMGINELSKDIKKTASAGAIMFTVHEDYGKKYVNEVKF